MVKQKGFGYDFLVFQFQLVKILQEMLLFPASLLSVLLLVSASYLAFSSYYYVLSYFGPVIPDYSKAIYYFTPLNYSVINWLTQDFCLLNLLVNFTTILVKFWLFLFYFGAIFYSVFGFIFLIGAYVACLSEYVLNVSDHPVPLFRKLMIVCSLLLFRIIFQFLNIANYVIGYELFFWYLFSTLNALTVSLFVPSPFFLFAMMICSQEDEFLNIIKGFSTFLGGVLAEVIMSSYLFDTIHHELIRISYLTLYILLFLDLYISFFSFMVNFVDCFSKDILYCLKKFFLLFVYLFFGLTFLVLSNINDVPKRWVYGYIGPNVTV